MHVQLRQQPLQGAKVLVVEDEFLVALDMERQLGEHGCLVSMASSPQRALAQLDIEVFDAAILDLNLSGERPTVVAERLIHVEVPFLVVTGYGNRKIDIPILDDAPRLSKPVRTKELISVLSGLVGRGD